MRRLAHAKYVSLCTVLNYIWLAHIQCVSFIFMWEIATIHMHIHLIIPSETSLKYKSDNILFVAYTLCGPNAYIRDHYQMHNTQDLYPGVFRISERKFLKCSRCIQRRWYIYYPCIPINDVYDPRSNAFLNMVVVLLFCCWENVIV